MPSVCFQSSTTAKTCNPQVIKWLPQCQRPNFLHPKLKSWPLRDSGNDKWSKDKGGGWNDNKSWEKKEEHRLPDVIKLGQLQMVFRWPSSEALELSNGV